MRAPLAIRSYLEALPDLTLVVNNAGSLDDGAIARMTAERWDAVLETHLTGAFRVIQAVLPSMLRRREGHFIQISSYSAKRPPVGQASYASAKAGLISLTQSLAAEYGSRNIRANCVLPGFLETKMTRSLDSDRVEQVRQQHALQRFNTAEDVARFLPFLHSLTNVSGQAFQLDSRPSSWT